MRVKRILRQRSIVFLVNPLREHRTLPGVSEYFPFASHQLYTSIHISASIRSTQSSISNKNPVIKKFWKFFACFAIYIWRYLTKNWIAQKHSQKLINCVFIKVGKWHSKKIVIASKQRFSNIHWILTTFYHTRFRLKEGDVVQNMLWIQTNSGNATVS